MKKIKLSFRNEWDRFAFYDIAWCKGYAYPQCENCSRNPNRYENWQPDGCYTGILITGQQAEQAQRGNCPHFTPLT